MDNGHILAEIFMKLSPIADGDPGPLNGQNKCKFHEDYSGPESPGIPCVSSEVFSLLFFLYHESQSSSPRSAFSRYLHLTSRC